METIIFRFHGEIPDTLKLTTHGVQKPGGPKTESKRDGVQKLDSKIWAPNLKQRWEAKSAFPPVGSKNQWFQDDPLL